MRVTVSRRNRVARPASDVDTHVQLARATWPQIDPEVEGIVVRIARAADLLDRAARASLRQVELTREEFKVICALHAGGRSHGSLCDELAVSTGAMTNRLDKLERTGLVERSPDPSDRRGVRVSLTPAGRAKLNDYIELGAAREQALVSGLSSADKRGLNQLLAKLLDSLRADLSG
jgi:DNA-binding MarR family transcriptional regulator